MRSAWRVSWTAGGPPGSTAADDRLLALAADLQAVEPGGLQISGQGEETVICGLVADQAALHGLLTKVRDLGLCLISVRRLDTG